jgi:hypothetical protein
MFYISTPYLVAQILLPPRAHAARRLTEVNTKSKIVEPGIKVKLVWYLVWVIWVQR